MKLKGIINYDCTKCMLGAPYEICWQTQCVNYSLKKKKEEQWENLIKECLKDWEKKL